MKVNLKNGMILGTMMFMAACSQGEKTSTENTVQEKKPVQIEYWHVASETFGGGAIKELIKEFNT